MRADVSRETSERLDEFSALVSTWNGRINLIGPCTDEELERRHIADSLQLSGLVRDRNLPLADLGSGGGFPGLVVSICRPDLQVICVESDGRKAAFLQEAIRRLGLNAEVRNERIESTPPLNARIVTARALAPLPRLLEYVARHLADGGTALLMKGRKWQEELEQARTTWQFRVEAASSRTDPQAVILSIGGLRRA